VARLAWITSDLVSATSFRWVRPSAMDISPRGLITSPVITANTVLFRAYIVD